MTQGPLEFDEIGVWSELKLEIVEKYGSAYTNAFRTSTNLKKYYIDGFSGAGVHVSRRTGKQIEGSPTRALKVSPPFDRYHFIDLDKGKTDFLRSTCGHRSDGQIHTGDCNDRFVPKPLPMRNSTNAVVYYLFLASQKSVAEKMINDIFSKYR